MATYQLHDIARLPSPDDNVAIATRLLPGGSVIADGPSGAKCTTDYTVMEGHRFAVRRISAGDPVLSWGLPFGVAIRPIQPGEYVRNETMLDALKIRELDFELPDDGNFRDQITPYALDEAGFRPGEQIPRVSSPCTFLGYPRAGGRVAGTRNTVIILATNSRTASYAQNLERKLKPLVARFPNIDDIVAIAHTEGGGTTEPNNREFLLRTLAGFVVHPNVGACLAVDDGEGPITNADLADALRRYGYPLDGCICSFLTLSGRYEDVLSEGERIVTRWLRDVDATPRTEVPLSDLKIAMQCGGSDAFSGVSGNPLSAWVVREVIRHGGSANLAETDELIGAESYVLQNVKDKATAQKFLEMVEWYKTLASWHGETAEGNPSGGNKFRGLYNIVLKSIGAAMKRHPDVRLDAVIDYAEKMDEPGYYFMNSPGNDLESIAGQVAAGCNLIYFVTGNGSITNFPFVPTIKFITTTPRYEMLSDEMDVNAGAYLDGTSMDALGEETFDLTLNVASGQKSKGELAGHAQVSIWRNWRQTDTDNVASLRQKDEPTPRPLPAHIDTPPNPLVFDAHVQAGRTSADLIGLVLPTSLCSAQVSRLAAEQLTERLGLPGHGLSRMVALPHTEGCGVAGESNELFYRRTLLGHLTHPFVALGHLLEHGCEKTHNDYFRGEVRAAGLSVDNYGWASIQLDGGIDRVIDLVEKWFKDRLEGAPAHSRSDTSIEGVRIGLHAQGDLSPEGAESLARTTRLLLGAGASVIIPESSQLLGFESYVSAVFREALEPSLPFGLHPEKSGLYVMETPTDHWVETLTGLSSAWCEVVLACTDGSALQGHPMVPVVLCAPPHAACAPDADVVLGGVPDSDSDAIIQCLLDTLSGRHQPFIQAVGNVDFQCTRGLLGISM